MTDKKLMYDLPAELVKQIMELQLDSVKHSGWTKDDLETILKVAALAYSHGVGLKIER